MRQETRLVPSWLLWALGSAGFAALTAIFAKVGVEKVAPDVATLVRTVVILVMLTAIVVATGQYRLIAGTSSRAYGFLLLSGLATGASWFCYFRALHVGDAARVAPIESTVTLGWLAGKPRSHAATPRTGSSKSRYTW